PLLMIDLPALLFLFYAYRDHRDLHSFPTRRSSDLAGTPHTILSTPGGRPASWNICAIAITALGESSGPLRIMVQPAPIAAQTLRDRKSTRLNSSHVKISYAVFCLKKKKRKKNNKTH